MKDSPLQAWLADCLEESTDRESQVEQDWREHTAQTHMTARKTTQQHYSATQETCNKREKIKSKTKTKRKSLILN